MSLPPTYMRHEEAETLQRLVDDYGGICREQLLNMLAEVPASFLDRMGRVAFAIGRLRSLLSTSVVVPLFRPLLSEELESARQRIRNEKEWARDPYLRTVYTLLSSVEVEHFSPALLTPTRSSELKVTYVLVMDLDLVHQLLVDKYLPFRVVPPSLLDGRGIIFVENSLFWPGVSLVAWVVYNYEVLRRGHLTWGYLLPEELRGYEALSRQLESVGISRECDLLVTLLGALSRMVERGDDLVLASGQGYSNVLDCPVPDLHVGELAVSLAQYVTANSERLSRLGVNMYKLIFGPDPVQMLVRYPNVERYRLSEAIIGFSSIVLALTLLANLERRPLSVR